MVEETWFPWHSTRKSHLSQGTGAHFDRGQQDRRKGCFVGGQLRAGCVARQAGRWQFAGQSKELPNNSLARQVARTHGRILPTGLVHSFRSIAMTRIFLTKIPMLKSCLRFLRGRLRECLSLALRERFRGKMVGDALAETRDWKLFALIPMMLQEVRGGRQGGVRSLSGRVQSAGG